MKTEVFPFQLPVPKIDAKTNKSYYTMDDCLSLTPEQYEYWVWSKDTIRVDEVKVYKSDIVNKIMTKCPWYVPYIFWPPIITYFLWEVQGAEWLWFLFGIILWFPIEYYFHKYIFHMPVKNIFTQKLQFQLHGVHHVAPADLYHIVSPPQEIIIQASAVYGILFLIGIPNPSIIIAGLLVQYLRYDAFHFLVHAFDISSLKKIPFLGHYISKCKTNHMNHHFHNPAERFSISYVLPTKN